MADSVPGTIFLFRFPQLPGQFFILIDKLSTF